MYNCRVHSRNIETLSLYTDSVGNEEDSRMLPPQITGKEMRIWDVVPSLLAALRLGQSSEYSECIRNYLLSLSGGQVDKYQKLCLVVVDGLGQNQLRERKGHIPFLRKHLEDLPELLDSDIYTCIPSTTVAALTSLNTGKSPAATGMLGYQCFDPENNQVLNLINFNAQTPVDPAEWSNQPTFFSDLNENGKKQLALGRKRFIGTELSQITLRDANYVPTETWEERISNARDGFQRGVDYTYIYVPELDHAGHTHGYESSSWIAILEEIDGGIRALREALDPSVLIALTADHGMVNVGPKTTVDLAKSAVASQIRAVAGEPRYLQVKLKEELLETSGNEKTVRVEIMAQWESLFSNCGWLLAPPAKIYPKCDYPQRLGDICLIAKSNWQFVDSRFHSPGMLKMIGVHGSITAAELSIPLILL